MCVGGKGGVLSEGRGDGCGQLLFAVDPHSDPQFDSSRTMASTSSSTDWLEPMYVPESLRMSRLLDVDDLPHCPPVRPILQSVLPLISTASDLEHVSDTQRLMEERDQERMAELHSVESELRGTFALPLPGFEGDGMLNDRPSVNQQTRQSIQPSTRSSPKLPRRPFVRHQSHRPNPTVSRSKRSTSRSLRWPRRSTRRRLL